MKEGSMRHIGIAASIAASFVLGVLSSRSAHAQALELTWTTAPTPGEASALESSNETVLPGNPLPEGISFQAIGDVIKAMVSGNKIVFRGAQETTIYRNSAPAVVLLKTNDGFGSGVILENGLI